MGGCCKCQKNKYCCVLTWFCLMFISMMVAGITLCCIQTTYEYPIYSEDRYGKLDYYMHYDYTTLYMGSGLTLAIVGFFGFIITCCFSCILGKSSEVEYEHVPNHTIPQHQYVTPQSYPIPQFQRDQMQM
ncbi:Hypothetical_protein [Hexamita inflata]|uniref:Hypothetical_protein n=1 Tax=Hexamita inflata TaxID=28002 RepID=A0AA86TYC0_9EUKA|nr:Hypothetical protein HINF_LOCUS20671 [Hexamita inflata]